MAFVACDCRCTATTGACGFRVRVRYCTEDLPGVTVTLENLTTATTEFAGAVSDASGYAGPAIYPVAAHTYRVTVAYSTRLAIDGTIGAADPNRTTFTSSPTGCGGTIESPIVADKLISLVPVDSIFTGATPVAYVNCCGCRPGSSGRAIPVAWKDRDLAFTCGPLSLTLARSAPVGTWTGTQTVSFPGATNPAGDPIAARDVPVTVLAECVPGSSGVIALKLIFPTRADPRSFTGPSVACDAGSTPAAYAAAGIPCTLAGAYCGGVSGCGNGQFDNGLGSGATTQSTALDGPYSQSGNVVVVSVSGGGGDLCVDPTLTPFGFCTPYTLSEV